MKLNKKIMRGGILTIIMMMLFSFYVSGEVYVYENFDIASNPCSVFYNVSGGTCEVTGGRMVLDNTGLTDLTVVYLEPAYRIFNKTITTSWDVEYYQFTSGTSTTYTGSYDITPSLADNLGTMFISSDNNLYIQGGSTGIHKNTFLNVETHFDLVFNATDQKNYWYINESLIRVANPQSIVVHDYEVLGFRGYNRLYLDNLIIQDGTHIGGGIATCQDGYDNDNDTFIDYPEDPDCTSLDDDEDVYDPYPLHPTFNTTLFYDHFNNSDYLIDGWVVDGGTCTETGTFIIESGVTCEIYHDFNFTDEGEEVKYDYIFVDTTGTNNIFYYFGATDYIEVVLDNSANTVSVTSSGACTGVTLGATSPTTYNDGDNNTVSLIVNEGNNSAYLYFNSELIGNWTDSDCFDTKLSQFYIDIVNNGMEANLFSATSINNYYPCGDFIDNDGDGYTDYLDDPECTTPYLNETIFNYHECNDGWDNDNDGYTDYPDDEGCTSDFDDDESPQQGTACSEPQCSESQWCILKHTFLCTDPLNLQNWDINVSWLGDLIETEDYNSYSVIKLNEFLGYTVELDNGTNVSTDSYIMYKQYTDNTKDYDAIDHEFVFFFDQNFGYSKTKNTSIYLTFYNSFFNENNVLFKVKVMPYIEDNGETWIRVYDVDEYGYEYGLGAGRTLDSINFGRFELHIVSDNSQQNYYVTWDTGSGERAEELIETRDFWIFTYEYPDRLSIEVDADSSDLHNFIMSDITSYLDKVDVYGTQIDTDTICTEYTHPYFFYEEFNGYMELCGWYINEEGIYNNGRLYITDDLLILDAYKDFSSLSSTESRFLTLDMTAVVYDYIDEVGYTMVELYDDENENVFAIYFSEDDTGILGTIGYYSDGTFTELDDFVFTDTQRIILVYDFDEDTFDLWTRGQYESLTLIGEDLPIVDPDLNPSDVSRIKIFGYKGTYALDSIKIYSSDSEGRVISTTNEPTVEIDDPYPEMVGNSMCGYIYKTDSKINCVEDEDCTTGMCLATGVCSSFDYNYCDENGKKRGDGCYLSAMTSCILESTKNIILDNLLLFIVFLIIVMFLLYFAIMMKGN